MNLFDKIKNLFKNDSQSVITCLGFALFLATNATVIWGGSFPFLPEVIQTKKFLLTFFASQAAAFTLGLASAITLGFFGSKILHTRRLVWVAGIPYFIGTCGLIAASYLPAYVEILAAICGVLIGFGTAWFFVAWQRLFAAMKGQECNHRLLISTLLAPFIYFALYLIPIAVTFLLVPLVFMPLFSLCLILTSRTLDTNSPMYLDAPKRHPKASVHVIKDYWRTCASVGTLAFCCGIIRPLALQEAGTTTLVNNISMCALLLGAAILLLIWRYKSLKINLTIVYKVIFPITLSAFMLVPPLGANSLIPLSSFLYALYSCFTVLIMIQCAQTARDRSINPVFIYGFTAAIVYALNDIGYVLGETLLLNEPFALEPHIAASLLAIYFLSMMFFIVHGGFKTALSPSRVQAETIELVTTGAVSQRNRAAAGEAEGIVDAKPVEAPYRDRTSKQCLMLCRLYKLSAREAEIIEAIARGNTIPGIAAILGLSENTVRTHIKRIYAKLDVHKKQELLDLVRSFDPSALVD